jgi:hypothetical protein
MSIVKFNPIDWAFDLSVTKNQPFNYKYARVGAANEISTAFTTIFNRLTLTSSKSLVNTYPKIKKIIYISVFFNDSFDIAPCLVLKITPLKILRQPTHRIC